MVGVYFLCLYDIISQREIKLALVVVQRLGPYFAVPGIRGNRHCCHLLCISKNGANPLLLACKKLNIPMRKMKTQIHVTR